MRKGKFVNILRPRPLEACVVTKESDNITLPGTSLPGMSVQIPLRQGREPTPSMAQCPSGAVDDLIDGLLAC